jgi:ATP-dependent Clp protease ATP-binding subunit ClpA
VVDRLQAAHPRARCAILPVVFERFTEDARLVMVLAQEEVRLMRHAHIGTEHLLVALARIGDDVASAVLAEHGLTGRQARAEVVRIAGVGDEPSGGQVPLTPAAHEALQGAARESLGLGHDHVEPAHLLLAVLRQRDALARRVLMGAGATPADARAAVIARLEARGPVPGATPSGRNGAVAVRLGEATIGDLGHPRVDGRLLLEILERRGAVAAWLRERGVDEEAVRGMLGD